MSVIIRLQNLPWSANALDIRSFFRGLSIPDGGVHIVGGEMGDAFIAFSTDEDARQAMMLDRKKINEVQIRLLLSSRAEMQKVIEQARQQSFAMMQMASKKPQVSTPQSPKSISAPQPPIITSTSLQNILSQQKSTLSDNVIQPLQLINQILSDNSTDSRDSRDKLPTDHTKVSDRDTRDIRDRDYFKTRERDRSGRSTHSRSRSRSRSRDRRRSRSRDRSSGRRRSYRSRTRSPDRRSRRRRSSRDRSRDRDRVETSKKDIRGRSRSRSRDRDRGRDYATDKKFAVEKNNKTEPAKSANISIDTNIQNETTSLLKQAPQSQTPVYTTNYGQGYNMNQMQYQAPNMPMLGNFQQYPTSLSQLQQLQLTQLQYQQQQQQQQKPQSILPQTQVLQNQQKDTKTFGLFDDKLKSQAIQNFLSSNLGSSLTSSLFNTNSSNAFNPGDSANLKTFQNPYTMNQKSNSSSFPLSGNNNSLNQPQPTDFSGFFNNNRNLSNENKSNNNNRDFNNRTFQNRNSSSRDDKYGSQFHSPRNYQNKIEGHCVKVSNMCPSTTYSDIRKFFSGLYIANNGIKLINDKTGNRIGVGYIRFVREDSKPKAILRNGSSLKDKNIIIENISESEFEEAIDSFKPNKWNKFQDDQDNNSTTDLNKEKEKFQLNPDEEFSAILLEDLPPFATEQDIIKMFSLYTLIDIILTRQTSGKKQYIAYVKFHQTEDAKKALSDRMKHAIGHRQVFVSPCSDEMFEKAKKLHSIEENDDDEMEINEEAEEDEDKDGKNENIKDTNDDDDDKNIIEKTSRTENDQKDVKEENISEDTKEKSTNDSFNEKNDEKTATPRIPSLLSLSPVPVPIQIPTDPRQRGGGNRGWGGGGGGGNMVITNRFDKTQYVYLKNFDYKATKADVLFFFSKINLTPINIEFLQNDRGQHNGELIIEFKNSDDAEKSLINHNTLCLNRRIKVELVSSNFVINKLSGNDNSGSANAFNDLQNSIRNFFSPNSNGGGSVNELNDNSNSNRDGGIRQRPSRFSDSNEKNMNIIRNNRFTGGNERSPNNNFYSGNRNRSNINNSNSNNGNQSLNNTTLDKFGKPGCVVSLENVPYKAGTEDIKEFFHKFNIDPNNIIRRYNDDGTPTGDARVSFSTPLEAQQAIKTKNKHKIFNRTIFLTLV